MTDQEFMAGKRSVWEILEAAEVHVPSRQQEDNGNPLWGELTVGADGWSFHCSYDGGEFDGFLWIETPDGKRIDIYSGHPKPDLATHILICWDGPGDLERLREVDWSYFYDFDLWLDT
ncbi:hypothetical protein [Microvirga yunnanensis]|uniref:hypothetical protein n=1 Tax=Microvirga yunnanensis TaxID=2953740 RepID=UPI0021C6CDCB|nr:hypothetical protein [Microvirga sp. HBU67655]